MKKISFLLIFIVLINAFPATAQLQFLHYPADTMGWVRGGSKTNTGAGQYKNDTFVVTPGRSGANNFIYNKTPVTLHGAASVFQASFDFRIDSNYACSDGLTFWFFTSSLYDLGSPSKEGGRLGFPDTVSGFALPLETIGCVDEIYMRKINSNRYSWSRGSGGTGDTNLCTYLKSQMFLTDSHWHHCVVDYNHGNITTTFDGGAVVMKGYSPITGTGHFGFMGTNGGGTSRKSIKNIQISASLGTPTDSTDSFGVYINKMCNGPQITVQTKTYNPAYHIKTFFGDGGVDNSFLSPGMTGGYVVFNHAYGAPGNYCVKQILYDLTTPIDSLTWKYENIFCSTLPVKLFYDNNINTIKDGAESFVTLPVLVDVDSNGKHIDTISTTSGFYYNTTGNPGDIYKFKVISMPGSMYVSTPLSGIITDTLVSGTFVAPVKYFGLNCGTGSTFDLSVKAVIPVTGPRDQWANVDVRNTTCNPTNATLTVTFSPKYIFKGNANPKPTTAVGNTLTWDLTGLSSVDGKPTRIHYQVDDPGTPLTIRDTVRTYFKITPTGGDQDTSNNTEIILDTVKAGCDPNEVHVYPEGRILSCAPLRYTINFENTGNDTAHNIYVMDTLSDDVDTKSLRVIMASHAMNVSIIKYGVHSVARFDFPNIKLLDSSFHDACTGYVTFDINTKTGLAYGTRIRNYAGIFFDVNDVVMTNTVENITGIPPITGVSSICSGGVPDTLKNDFEGGVWSSKNGKVAVVNGVITGMMSGVDTISYTVTNTCVSQSQTKVITVDAGGISPISGPVHVCVSSTCTLSNTTTGGIWSSAATAIATVGSTGVVTGITPGKTMISFTATNSCGTGTDTAIIDVLPLPKIFVVSGGKTLCTGDIGTHITLPGSEAGVGYQVYNGISKVGSLFTGTGFSIDFGLFNIAGTYTVTAESILASCSSTMTGSAIIVVKPIVLPSVKLLAISGDTICKGNAVTLKATPTNGGTAPIYRWRVNGIVTGGTTDGYSYIPLNGDVVTTTLMSSEICAKPDTAIDNLSMTVSDLLTPKVAISVYPAAIVKKGDTVVLTASCTDCGTVPAFQWILNGTPIPAATSAVYKSAEFSNADSLSCVVTSDGTCGGNSSVDSKIIHVSYLGIAQTFTTNEISIYPNPVVDELQIKTAAGLFNTFRISNSVGQVLLEEQLNATQTKVNVKHLPAGLYYLMLKGTNGSKVEKFVKM